MAHADMKTYLIEYTDPRTNTKMTTKFLGEDKTDARDRFMDAYPEVIEIARITWIPAVGA